MNFGIDLIISVRYYNDVNKILGNNDIRRSIPCAKLQGQHRKECKNKA